MKKLPHIRLLSLLIVLCGALLLSGCFETEQEFTINPDGSGKVIHQSTFQQIDLSNQPKDPEEAAKHAVAELLKKAKGIDAWQNLSFKALDDGRIVFKGTAYFKDLSKLEIPNQTFLNFDWQKTDRGYSLSTRAGDKHSAKAKEATDLAKLSPEAQAKKIKAGRGEFQQMKPMLIAFVSPLKHSAIFHLPGKVSQTSNFKIEKGGALSQRIEGDKVIAALEKLASDDAWIAKNIGKFGPSESPVMDDEVSALLFGTKGPTQATVIDASAPLFDYAAEIAAAIKAFPDFEKQLGVGAISIAPPAKGEPLKRLSVVGAQLIIGADEKRDIRPFNSGGGYTLALLGEFSGSVLSVSSQSILEKAIADDQSDLLPSSEFDRQFHFPRLSKDQTGVVFEVKLTTPGPKVRAIKEISGQLEYTVAGKTQPIDLGFTKLEAGAKGTQLGAEIAKFEQSGDEAVISVKLNGPTEAMKSMSIEHNGQKTELTARGYFGGNSSTTFSFASKNPIPANAHLVAEVYGDLKTFKVPFKLENLSLLGAPLQ